MKKIIKTITIISILTLLMCLASCKTIKAETSIQETLGWHTEPTAEIEKILIKPEVEISAEITEPPTGWQENENGKYYVKEKSYQKAIGLFTIEDKTYYFNDDGYMHTGWLELDGEKYYFLEDGIMAKGVVEIENKNFHFRKNGKYVVVVNPWNEIPDNFDTQLIELNNNISTEGNKGNQICVDNLTQMINDANKYSGSKVCIVSAYRGIETQTRNFNNKIKYFQNQGYDYNTAYEKAAQIIAVPGTSEHHLGLAFDIVDTQDWSLEERQENYKGQQWLMEHSWEYGFILRYPKNKTDVTGIIYEPWHYRYVGKEFAKELHESGLTIEEYFQR